jgi:cyclophilin family peptidyl-prolyl cis-trans isomerase
MRLAGLAVLLLVHPQAEKAKVRLRIDSAEKILRPGRKMPLRFTIENAGDSEGRVEEPDNYLEGLEIRDAEDRVVKPVGKTRGITRRAPVVEAGGFIGRVVDIAPALSVPEDREGIYRIRWFFGEATSEEIQVRVFRDWLAAIDTNHGKITVELFPDLAPNHVLGFMRLARAGLYDGSTFHRIIPGFMMQGGAPRDARAQVKPLKAELSDRNHVFGTVSAARGNDLDSATSEFFICFGAAPHLDRSYTVFGSLVEGADVVKEIEKVKSDHSPCKACNQVPARPGATRCCGTHHRDKPEVDVVIKKVTLAERRN